MFSQLVALNRSAPTTVTPQGRAVVMTGPATTRLGSTWRVVNITAVERTGRVAIGAAAAVTAVALLLSAGSWLGVVLEVLLLPAGLDMIFTGVTGHCSFYQRLGHLPVDSGGIR